MTAASCLLRRPSRAAAESTALASTGAGSGARWWAGRKGAVIT